VRTVSNAEIWKMTYHTFGIMVEPVGGPLGEHVNRVTRRKRHLPLGIRHRSKMSSLVTIRGMACRRLASGKADPFVQQHTHWNKRTPSPSFPKECVDVLQGCSVAESWQSVPPYYFVYRCLCTVLDLWIQNQCHYERSQSRSCLK
jgi:hypothetical protein